MGAGRSGVPDRRHDRPGRSRHFEEKFAWDWEPRDMADLPPPRGALRRTRRRVGGGGQVGRTCASMRYTPAATAKPTNHA